jgi:integrase/recombinase XerC
MWMTKVAAAKLQPDPHRALHDLTASFLGARQASTLAAYRRDLEDLCIFMDSQDFEEMVGEMFGMEQARANWVAQQWRDEMFKQNLKPASINRKLSALRFLARYARKLGIVPWEIEIENIPHAPYRDTRGPGVEAIQQMMQLAAGQGGAKGARDLALLRLAFDLALRRGEIAKLNREDVDLENYEIKVTGKGRREESILSLSAECANALSAWIKARGEENGPLFQNLDSTGRRGRLTPFGIYKIIRKLGKKVGVITWPHAIRHTAITVACETAQKQRIPLEEVLEFSRHKQVQTLLVYRDHERSLQGQIVNLVSARVVA